MLSQHLHQLMLARVFTACTLAFLGVFQIAAPRCFWGLSIYFRGVWRLATSMPNLTAQHARLTRVLEARERAEGDSDALLRYAGAFTIAMAGLALSPQVPFILPYALSCLAMAAAIMLSYLRFRRVTERRVAPLVRRSPWKSLPPFAMFLTVLCLLGAASFAYYPEFRAGSAIVVFAAIALLAVAWRVALSPAILFGDDSQLEYIVDEHLRFCRAMSLVTLACAPATAFVGLAWAVLPSNAHFFNVVTVVVALAFTVVLGLSLNPLRRRISLA